MKILHTSDWHIGKKLMGRERYDEYRAVLSEISSICEREEIELVLVAGDVYDTYTPSAEAEQIFYDGVKQIAKHCAVMIISGNHDDYVRLTAASSFARELGVYIVGNNLQKTEGGATACVKVVDSNSGYVVFENDKGEQVYINLLPYPNEARFKEGKSDESFNDKMSRWIAYGERGKTKKIPSIFLSHIFVAGGLTGDSEREIDLGGARIVPTAMLPDCDYCALGHLHRRQKIGANVYYSGAIMQFSFDEAGKEKSVNVFDIDGDGVKNFKQIALKASKNLIRLQANCAADGVKLLNANAQCFVELTLNLSAPLTPAESSALHECENLVSLKANVARMQNEVGKISNKEKSSSQLFTEFYKLKYDNAPPEELLALFLSLTEEE
ncbi:MAG: exonuclease subunit SbcD [Clostridia bacterium]|nr:exonuclease subunit SbcD [Clostridia bacterium]